MAFAVARNIPRFFATQQIGHSENKGPAARRSSPIPSSSVSTTYWADKEKDDDGQIKLARFSLNSRTEMRSQGYSQSLFIESKTGGTAHVLFVGLCPGILFHRKDFPNRCFISPWPQVPSPQPFSHFIAFNGD